MLNQLYVVYCDILDDLCEAAGEDYLEYISSEFEVSQIWDTEDEAAGAMNSLLDEVYQRYNFSDEDMFSDEEMLEYLRDFGLTQELIDHFHLEIR